MDVIQVSTQSAKTCADCAGLEEYRHCLYKTAGSLERCDRFVYVVLSSDGFTVKKELRADWINTSRCFKTAVETLSLLAWIHGAIFHGQVQIHFKVPAGHLRLRQRLHLSPTLICMWTATSLHGYHAAPLTWHMFVCGEQLGILV